VIAFLPLRPEHLPLLHAWFARPHLQQWWTAGEAFTLAQVEEEYGVLTRGEDPARGFLLEVDGRPAGYAQYYPVDDASLPDGVTKPDNGLRTGFSEGELAGVDLFLADPQSLGQGMGTAVLKAFLQTEIFPKYRAAVVDPLSINARAIRSFEKSGFRRTGYSEDPATVVLVALRPPG
jgi:aminoglycoside 6'-N-acetyltransferase